VEREAPGGQAGLSSRIENYLGFPSGLTGGDLTRRAVAQARRFGVEIVSPQEAIALRVDGPYRYLRLNDGTELSCHAMVLATGVQWRKLNIPGMDRLQGAGVYYGGTTTGQRLGCKFLLDDGSLLRTAFWTTRRKRSKLRTTRRASLPSKALLKRIRDDESAKASPKA
jgi:thioredoxin reductase